MRGGKPSLKKKFKNKQKTTLFELIFEARPMAYGGSQAMGQIRATPQP